MRVLFPHIPKCAGGTIRRQIEGRQQVFLDYFSHPTWQSAVDREAGARAREVLKGRLRERGDWLVFGHFAAADYYDLEYDLQVLLLRPPLARAISHYHYIRDLQADTPVTRRRHREVGEIKDGVMPLEAFCRLDHVRHFYAGYYLKGVRCDDRTLTASTDDLTGAFARIADATGLSLDTAVRANRSEYSGDFAHLKNLFAADEALYQRLTST